MGYRFWGRVLAVVLAAALLMCCRSSEEREPQVADTLYTERTAMAVSEREPERALAIIDSGVAVGNISDDGATFLRAKIFVQSPTMHRYDTAQLMLQSLLARPFADTDLDHREMVLDMLVTVSRMRGDNVQYLRWATEKADFCRQQGLETEAWRTDAEMGVVLVRMGEEEKGLAKLDAAIAALDGQRHFDEMDACIIALKRKINVLGQLGRYEEMVPLAKRIVEKLDDYRQHPDLYADDSYRRPATAEDGQAYCDFYTSQAHGFLSNAYGVIGAADSARRYLALCEQGSIAQTPNGKLMMATACGHLKEWGRMLSLFDEVYSSADIDTMNSDYCLMLLWRAQAAEVMGNLHIANGYLHRHVALQQELNDRLLKSRAYEYAARYQLQEERLRAERERLRADRIRNQATLLFLLVVVCAAAVIWLTVQHRAIKRKNRVLAEQIAQRVGSGECVVDKDTDLFAYIDRVIRMEQLYLSGSFSRQAIMDRFHIDERRVGSLFAKAGGVSVYVRRLRVEHACRLIGERPDMSLADIATASGFSNPSVFSREFKNELEITPSYYRSQLAAKD